MIRRQPPDTETPVTDPSYAFTHALVRRPSDSAVDGLRDVDTGAPDIARFREDHADYVAALEAAGVRVTVLPPLAPFPDAVFIEDVALCLPRCAVLLAPGAPSRRGEVESVREPLLAHYADVLELVDDGASGAGAAQATLEGGDVLVSGHEVLVGLSARTNAAGAAALARRLAPFGHAVRVVETPAGVLHFKSDCSLLDERTVLATERLARSGCFEGYDVVLVAPGEEAAANAVRVNDRVLFPAGHPESAARVADAGYRVHELGNGEGAKLDGGMSCLSLRFAVAGSHATAPS